MATDAPTAIGRGFGPVRAFPGDVSLYFAEVGSSAAYATGGVVLTLPTDVKAKNLLAVCVLTPFDGTRAWQWNGSRTAPTLIAYDGFAAQEGAGAITPVTLDVMFVYASS